MTNPHTFQLCVTRYLRLRPIYTFCHSPRYIVVFALEAAHMDLPRLLAADDGAFMSDMIGILHQPEGFKPRFALKHTESLT